MSTVAIGRSKSSTTIRGVDRKPSMKLTFDKEDYRRSANLKRRSSSFPRRSLKEKKQVRSSIMASLDRQLSYLPQEEDVKIPFDSVVSNQIILHQQQQSYYEQPPQSPEPSPLPKKQLKQSKQSKQQQRIVSARTSKILESLDKHIVTVPPPPPPPNDDNDDDDLQVLRPSLSMDTTPKASSRKTLATAATTPSTTTTTTTKSPKRISKKQPSATTTSTKKKNKTFQGKILNAGSGTSGGKKKKRRSISLEAQQRKTTTSSSKEDSFFCSPKRRSASLGRRPSAHDTTITTTTTTTTSCSSPQHLQQHEKEDNSNLASFWSSGDGNDVAIANLTPATMIATTTSSSTLDEEGTATSSITGATPNSSKTATKKKKKKKKKKKQQRDSIGSKRSQDSSLNTSSFDRSLGTLSNTLSTSISFTIEEGEEPSSSSHHNYYLNGILSNNADVAIGNLMPVMSGKGKAPLSPSRSQQHIIPPPPTTRSPPISPGYDSNEKRTSDSSFDSDAQFEHFYAEPTKRASVVSQIVQQPELLAEEELEEAEELDFHLMEASMSLSDIFGCLKDEDDRKNANSVMIGNLTPSKKTPTKKEMTVTPMRPTSPVQQSTPKKKRWSLRGQRMVDDADINGGNTTPGTVDKRSSFGSGDRRGSFGSIGDRRGSFGNTNTTPGTGGDRRGSLRNSLRSIRTVESWFSKNTAQGAGEQQPPENDDDDENSQDLASKQRLAAIFGEGSPFADAALSPTSAATSKQPLQPNWKIESPENKKQSRTTTNSSQAQQAQQQQDITAPKTPTDADYYEDQDEKSRDRIRAIFGADHHLALASPEPHKSKSRKMANNNNNTTSSSSTSTTTTPKKEERRGSLGSLSISRSPGNWSLHSRFSNRTGRSKESKSTINNNNNGNGNDNSSARSFFSTKSGRSRGRSIDGSQQQQERRDSIGSRSSLKSALSAGSSSVVKPTMKKNTKKKKERSRSPLKRAFSPLSRRSKSPPKRVSDTLPQQKESSEFMDDDQLIVEGVLKRYNTEQCDTFEDHQEMAEAELISSITNTSPAELRRLKNKLAERLREKFLFLVNNNNNNNRDYQTEDDSVNNSDHLIEVYNDDERSDVTSLTSLTSFTNFGGSVRTHTKSSRTLDRPSNSALNYHHPNEEDAELVFVKSLPIHGGKYSGTVCSVSSQPHGQGRLVYRGNKGIYSGEWKQGQWYGKGKHIKPNGDYYEGQFLDNLYHGEGVFSYKQSGRFFEGQYVMGERTKGTMRYADGSVYKGQFYHGRRHGRGSYTFKDGSRYKGDFYKDLMQGIGELRFRDGSSYVGEWKRGKHEGQGSMYSPDGMLCWAGMWQDGQQVLA